MSELENIPEIEDILVRQIFCFRHGDKDQTGFLTNKGYNQAIEKGIRSEILDGQVLIAHSGSFRTVETGKAFAEFLHMPSGDLTMEEIDNHREQYHKSSAFNVPFPCEENSLLYFLESKDLKTSFFDSWSNPEKGSEHDKKVQEFLNNYDISPNDHVPSPELMAKQVAQVLVSELDGSSVVENGDIINYVNITHEPVLMSFLAYMASDFQQPPLDIVKTLGGSVDYTEGFILRVYKSDKDPSRSKLKVEFRNKQYEIDMDVLRTFAQIDRSSQN